VVIVKLIGGLGNQMFQYAAGRSLSLYHGVPLKLDVSWFETQTLRRYGLHVFRIREDFASPEDIARVQGITRGRLPGLAWRMRHKILPSAHCREPYFKERQLFVFDPSIARTPRDVYLLGSWQTEKYFVDTQDIIRREFTVKYQQDHQSREIAENITATQSVSIHVRRGDYVSNPRTNRVHGTCSLDYYRRCVAWVAERITYPHFFIFSDDPSWASANLRLDYPTTFVPHNDVSRAYDDLRLMSVCKHDIIANSSFSWWGAWLNSNPHKMVLAPRKWFNEGSFDTRDLLPDDWIRV